MNFDPSERENLVAVISEEHPYSQETEVSPGHLAERKHHLGQ